MSIENGLDTLVELRLEKAFAKLDFDAVFAIFKEVEDTKEALQDELDEVGSQIEQAEARVKEARLERDGAITKEESETERADKAEKAIDEIYDLVEPLIKKKTRVQVIKEIWEIVKP